MYKHLNKHGKNENQKIPIALNTFKRSIGKKIPKIHNSAKNVIMQSSRNPAQGSRTAVKKRHVVSLLPTLKDDGR